MRGPRSARAALCSLLFAGILPAQTPAKIDFGSEVLPILRQNCFGCHGPAQQVSGLRLDRRSVVMGRRGVVPGSSENSFLYHRISGTAYGMQMPPTGPLRVEQIRILKTWIDQGADWPDSLANEAELPPINPKAVAMVEACARATSAPLTRPWQKSQSCSTRVGPRAPLRLCTRCSMPVRPRCRGC